MLNEITKLSEKHNEGFPLLAVILFNNSHAHLIESLKNQSYVNSLHEITGNEICVFWAALPEGRMDFPKLPKGFMGMMVPVYCEPSQNKLLYEYFDIKNGESLPLLITFTYGGAEEIFYSKHRLSDLSAESAFNSLREILKEKSKLLNDFSAELKSNKEKMFSELNVFDFANTSLKAFSNFLKIIPMLKLVKSI